MVDAVVLVGELLAQLGEVLRRGGFDAGDDGVVLVEARVTKVIHNDLDRLGRQRELDEHRVPVVAALLGDHVVDAAVGERL